MRTTNKTNRMNTKQRIVSNIPSNSQYKWYMDYLEFVPMKIPQGNQVHYRIGFDKTNPEVNAKREQLYRKTGQLDKTYFVYPLKGSQFAYCSEGRVNFCIVDAYSPLEACLMALMAMWGGTAEIKEAIRSGSIKLEKTSSQTGNTEFVAELIKVKTSGGSATFERYSYKRVDE